MNFRVYLQHLTNTLNAELNPICHLLALLGARHILHFSRIRVKASGRSDLTSQLFTSRNMRCDLGSKFLLFVVVTSDASVFLYSHIRPFCDLQDTFFDIITVNRLNAGTNYCHGPCPCLMRDEFTANWTCTLSSKFGCILQVCLAETEALYVGFYPPSLGFSFPTVYGASWTDRLYTVSCVRLYWTYYYVQSGNNISVSRLTHLLLKFLPLPFIACVAFSHYCFTSYSDIVRIMKSKRLRTHEVAYGDSGKILKIRAHWGAVAPKEGKKERKKLCIEQFHDLQSSNVMTLIGFGARGTEGGSLPLRVPLKVRHNLEDLGLDGKMLLTHNSGRVTQICVFNTVKLGTSASSP